MSTRRPIKFTRNPSRPILESLECRRLFTTYYVSPTGNDSNPGTSSGQPWASLARVNSTFLYPGDSVLLQGGGSFSGGINLAANESGTASAAITISSYGTGRATINSGGADGINSYNDSYLLISNLNIVGAGGNSNFAYSGIHFYTDAPESGIAIDQVAVSDFTVGIEIGAGSTSSGYSGIRVTNSSADSNSYAGMDVYGQIAGGSQTAPATVFSNSNLYIAGCTAANNTGILGASGNTGSGIEISGTDGGVIEHNVAYQNGINNQTPDGPTGIWAVEANNITIRYNESYHNETSASYGGDGDGFDLDGGVTNSVVEYNYSHDNYGTGFLLFEYGTATANQNNTVRYNISENDGTLGHQASVASGGSLSSEHIYNNTVYKSSGSQSAAIDIQSGASSSDFRNNILVTTGGIRLVDGANASFQGNDYWASGAAFNLAGYSSLAAFRSGTGQETYNSAATGFQVAPGLTNAGGGGTIGNAYNLTSLSAYQLQTGSPMIDTALSLQSDFGETPGSTDFYGTSVPQGNAFDVGASEYPQSAGGVTQPSDASFETPNESGGYQYAPSGTPWTFTTQTSESNGTTYDGSGITAGTGTPFTGGNPSGAPDGSQVAFVQGQGSITQTVSFAAGTYTIGFAAAQRVWDSTSQSFQVLVDGVAVGTFRPASGGAYATYQTPAFTVAGGSHVIALTGQSQGGGDNTAFIDNVRIFGQLGDGSFETPGESGGYQYAPTGTPWAFTAQSLEGNGTTYDGSGITAGSSNAFTGGNPTGAPDGSQVAFLQGQGTIAQSISLAAGTYTVSFDAAQRVWASTSQSFQVLVDGIAEGTFRPASGGAYAAYQTSTFTVAAGSHTITFKGQDQGGGDNTALIDDVLITLV